MHRKNRFALALVLVVLLLGHSAEASQCSATYKSFKDENKNLRLALTSTNCLDETRDVAEWMSVFALSNRACTSFIAKWNSSSSTPEPSINCG